MFGRRSAADGAKRPVMVWLHGGAFSYGSANSERLQRQPSGNSVVMSSLLRSNHRLNIFGHLDLSGIGGLDYRHSGNAGVLDLVAALTWVRGNIARFGGDPGNVTIFGESGGGGKVSTLLAMPSASGLFHKAIIQSGAAVRLRTKERAMQLTEHVMRELGSTAIEQLQRLPVARLLAAIKPAERALGPSPYRLFDRYPFGPVVDGDVLPRQPFDPDASDFMNDIPLIIGDMKDETASFLAPDDLVWHRTLSEAQMVDRVHAIAGADTNRVVETYRRLYPKRQPGGSVDRHDDRLQLPHSIADTGAAAERQGNRTGVDVCLQLGNAGTWRQNESAARDGCSIHIRHDRFDQCHRWRCRGEAVGRDDVRCVDGFRA